jgi:hypothetical protein
MRTDREKHGLMGPVKSIRIETAGFDDKGGQLAERPWLSQTMTFNQDGWLIEQVHRNPDMSEWRTINDYSHSGRLLTTKGYDRSSILSSEVRYIYDDEARLVAEHHITRDGKVTTPTTYAYDNKGRRIKIQELEFSGEGDVMVGIEGTNTAIRAGDAKRVETRYDALGGAVEVKVFNAGGVLVSRVEITRDARGNPIEEATYVGDVAQFGPCTPGSCSTDEMAALTEEQKVEFAVEITRLLPPGTAMSKHSHSYDREGRLIESKLTMMGMQPDRRTLAYDEAGNKTEEISYKEDGTLGTKAVFTREYDEHVNWTKELVSTASSWDAEFGLSTPAHVTHRLITYW